MLILNPEVVRFEQWVWEDVWSVAVERVAARVAESWGEFGPHAEMVDVPEVRTTVRVTRRLDRGDIDGPVLGMMGELTLYTAPTWSDQGRRRVRVGCVCTSVKTEVDGAGDGLGGGAGGAGGAGKSVTAKQVLTFAAVSAVGAGGTDPVVIEVVLGGGAEVAAGEGGKGP